ncbi:MAG: hypothetical protein ACK4SM_06935, partial [Aquificaceae bacterium]
MEKKEDIMDKWSSALKEQEEASKQVVQEETKPNEVESGLPDKLKKFLDIPLQVEVIVGSTVMT